MGSLRGKENFRQEGDDKSLTGLVSRETMEVAMITGALVHCVVCIDEDGRELTHIFSTVAKAQAFASTDPRDHVLYDYVIDCPERMEATTQ